MYSKPPEFRRCGFPLLVTSTFSKPIDNRKFVTENRNALEVKFRFSTTSVSKVIALKLFSFVITFFLFVSDEKFLSSFQTTSIFVFENTSKYLSEAFGHPSGNFPALRFQGPRRLSDSFWTNKATRLGRTDTRYRAVKNCRARPLTSRARGSRSVCQPLIDGDMVAGGTRKKETRNEECTIKICFGNNPTILRISPDKMFYAVDGSGNERSDSIRPGTVRRFGISRIETRSDRCFKISFVEIANRRSNCTAVDRDSSKIKTKQTECNTSSILSIQDRTGPARVFDTATGGPNQHLGTAFVPKSARFVFK